MMSPFKNQVLTIVRSIPEGKVVSYGQVALYAGLPRAARQVGWILNGTEGRIDLPWWRVVNTKGYLSIRGTQYTDKELQAKLLRAEGVQVAEDFTLSMKRYRYLPTAEELARFDLDESYIRLLLDKYLL